MDIRALLPRHHVVLHLKGRARRDLLYSLVQPLAADALVSDVDVFLSDLERRENEITTQVNPRVAFPHARSTAVTRLALSVGLADAPGLPFNLQMSASCRLFFLIGVPAFAPTAHLPLLQQLANFAHDDESVGKLLAAETVAQAIRCLTGFRT